MRDFINLGKDGVIVLKVNGVFSAEEMAKVIESAIKNKEETHRMAIASIEKSKQYSLDYIANHWIGWLDKLKN